MTVGLYERPADLPVPVDDGAAAHLRGAALQARALASTSGRGVSLAEIAWSRAVVFRYFRTGVSGEPPGLEWDAIPGARG